MRSRFLRILLVAGLCLAVGDLLQGQTIVWSGAGNRFVTGTNWVGGVAPGSTDTAQFGNHAGATTIMVNTTTINNLEFTAVRPATHNFSYDDGTAILTLNGNFTAQGTGSASAINFYINSTNKVDLALPSGEHVFDIGALTTVTIASVVSGTGHVSKIGAGTLVLTGANTFSYSGGFGFLNSTSIREGTVFLNGGAINHGTNGDIWVGEFSGDNGTLAIANGGTASGYYGVLGSVLGSTGTATIDGGTSSWTVSNGMSVGSGGTGSLTLSNGGKVNIVGGAGTLNVGASSGSTGTLNIGAASGDAAATGGIVNAAAITTANGASGTIQFNTTGTAASPYYLTKDGTSGGTAVAINGAGSVVNTDGFTVLGSSNAYTGSTTINGGALVVSALANGGSASSIGASSSAAGNLVLNGGILRYTGGNGTTDRLFTLGVDGGTLDISNATVAGSFTFSNTGSVALTGTNTARTLNLAGTPGYTSTVFFNSQLGDNGAGATSVVALDGSFWRLAAANTYSGGTTVNSGGFLIATNTAGSATGTGAVTVNSGGRLGIGSNSPDGAISGNIVVNGTGTVEFNRSTAYTYAGVISGTGSVLHTGTAGNITLTGANTYTGGTTVNGTLRIGNGGNSGALAGNVTNNGTLIFDRNDYSSFFGNVSGTGTLFKQSGGTIALTGTHTYAGGTTITSGIINLTGSISHGSTDFLINGTSASPALITSSGGDLTADRLRLGITSSSFTGFASVDGAGSTLTANTYIYVGEAGFGQLQATNGGSISSANTSIGNNTGGDGEALVSGAGSTFSNSSTLYVGSAGTGYIEISNGGLVSNVNGVVGNNPGGSGNVYLDTGGSWTSSGNLTVANAGNGDISAFGGSTVSATNATIGSLSGVFGSVSLQNAGTLLSTTNNLVVGNAGDGQLEVKLGADTVTGGQATLGSAAGSSGLAFVEGAGSTWTITGGLTVGGSGTGEVRLIDQGLLTVNSGGGTVTLGNSAGSAGHLYFGDYDGEGGNASGVLNAALITTGSGLGKIHFESATSTQAAPLYVTKDGTSGGTSIIIAGSTLVEHDIGYTVLTGNNTYTGGTTVNGGTLVMGSNNALGTGSVTLNGGSLSVASGITFGNALNIGVSGGRLGGNGSFSSPLTLGSGVTLAPGNSPGTLNFTSGLTLNDGGALEIEVRAVSGTPGTDWDFINVTGVLNLSGLSTGGYTLKAISLSLADTPNQPISGLTGPTSWTIATASSGITGFQAADFVFDIGQFYGGGVFSLSQSGNSLLLNFVPVPEPSTYALMLAGLALGGLHWRRRRNRT